MSWSIRRARAVCAPRSKTSLDFTAGIDAQLASTLENAVRLFESRPCVLDPFRPTDQWPDIRLNSLDFRPKNDAEIFEIDPEFHDEG
jgi:hypothetical protein